MNTDTIRAFGAGYLEALAARRISPSDEDEWIDFEEFNLNIIGSNLSDRCGENGLTIAVYPRDWTDQLPAELAVVVIARL